MAFTESDRVSIRMYLGAGSVFLQQFPKLENAITAAQSIADGGVQLDGSLETLILSIITELDAIETKLTGLHCSVNVVSANKNEVVLDTARGIFLLKSEGRRKIGVLSRALSCSPIFDYYNGQQASSDDFADIDRVL